MEHPKAFYSASARTRPTTREEGSVIHGSHHRRRPVRCVIPPHRRRRPNETPRCPISGAITGCATLVSTVTTANGEFGAEGQVATRVADVDGLRIFGDDPVGKKEANIELVSVVI